MSGLIEKGAFSCTSWVCKKLASAQTLGRGFRNESIPLTVGKFKVLKMRKIMKNHHFGFIARSPFFGVCYDGTIAVSKLRCSSRCFRMRKWGRSNLTDELKLAIWIHFVSIICISKISGLKRFKKRMAITPPPEKMEKRKLVVVVVGHFEYRKAQGPGLVWTLLPSIHDM